jgi:protein-serine/threonine kinase
MTQLFHSNATTTNLATEKRTFTGLSLAGNKQVNGTNSQLSQKVKNFFRIDRHDTKDGSIKEKEKRQSRFQLPTISRNRSTTVASEGNTLDDTMSPTAHANPYFAHQGPPALRHHNADSVPPSPPDTPQMANAKAEAVAGNKDQPTTAGKEELARKLRRVASAPNAQGMFSGSSKNDGRPQTAELGKEPLVQHPNSSTLSMVESSTDGKGLLQPPAPGYSPNSTMAFRRTYSSNSIKVRNVEVGPGSFDKIKLIGKGDVGKVYLVREKKSNRPYAMKGKFSTQHLPRNFY